MADYRIDIRYSVQDLADAQRQRFLKGGQWRLLLVFWGISTFVLVLHLLFPQTVRFLQGVTWEMIFIMSGGYVLTMAVVLFVMPFVSFHFSRFWKLPLEFHFNDKALRVNVAEKSGGLRLKWDEVTSVQETARVFVMYYRAEKFFVLPKRAFSVPGSERRFRAILEDHQLSGKQGSK